MDTIFPLIIALHSGEWIVEIDLKDTCHHILMHPQIRKYYTRTSKGCYLSGAGNSRYTSITRMDYQLEEISTGTLTDRISDSFSLETLEDSQPESVLVIICLITSCLSPNSHISNKGSNTGSVNGLVSLGNKPLSDSSLTQIYCAIWHN